jgi:hypothetical protein
LIKTRGKRLASPDRREPREVARATNGATELALGYFNYLAVALFRVDLFLCVDHGAYSAGQGNS